MVQANGRDPCEVNNMVRLATLDFAKVSPGIIVLGSNKGGWMYSSQRPAYEACLPTYYTMNTYLNHEQIASILGLPVPSGKAKLPVDDLTEKDLEEVAQSVMECNEFKEFCEAQDGEWEIRLPSEAEWYLAQQQNAIELRAGGNERLVDGPTSNNRGAMMDGRPRPNELIGPAASQSALMAVHPRNTSVFLKGTVPAQRALPDVFARFVLTPIRSQPAKRVPSSADTWANVRSELLWTTVLGIVPSFAIPIARGMGAYAIDGWFNLFFGGLCVGFFTGAIWRPKRPILRYDSVQPSKDTSDNVSQ